MLRKILMSAVDAAGAGGGAPAGTPPAAGANGGGSDAGSDGVDGGGDGDGEGVFWRNKKELQDTIITTRHNRKAIEEVNAKLDQLLAGQTPPKVPKESPSESPEVVALRERVDAAERKSAWNAAVSGRTDLSKRELRLLKTAYDAEKPSEPEAWLSEYLGDPPTADDGDRGPKQVTGDIPGQSGAPGRNPKGMPANYRVLMKEDPAAWRAMGREKRREMRKDYRDANRPPPLFPLTKRTG